MINFGFKISADRQIDFDANDRSVAVQMAKLEPTFNICISCGTCAATCSAAKFTDFSFHKVVTLVKRGEMSGLKSKLSQCMLCGKCVIACPRGVNTRNIVLQLNRLL